MGDILGRPFDFKTRKERAKRLLAAREEGREARFKKRLEEEKSGDKPKVTVGKRVVTALKSGRTGFTALAKTLTREARVKRKKKRK